MAGQARITFVGSLGGDPESRDVGGASVASFSVAVSERTKQGDQWVDGATTWYRCSAWRELGANAVATLHKGDRVIIDGTIGERKYTTKEGEERSSWEVTVEEIGPSLRFATASVQRVQRGGQQPQRGGQQTARGGYAGSPQPPQQGVSAGWPSASTYDDTPF